MEIIVKKGDYRRTSVVSPSAAPGHLPSSFLYTVPAAHHALQRWALSSLTALYTVRKINVHGERYRQILCSVFLVGNFISVLVLVTVVIIVVKS